MIWCCSERKKVENKCKDLKVFVLVRDLLQWKRPSLYAQYDEKKLEETPFYASNATVGFIKDALAYESAYPRQ